MKIVLDLLFILVLIYSTIKVIELLLKMKENILLPTSLEESQCIYKHPEKAIQLPNYSYHKVGIILYFLMLVFVVVMFILGAFINEGINWSFYLLLFLPLAHSYNLFNLFAIVDEGLLYGSRFVPWKRIESFQFISIDRNHRFYGYSKEVNENGYELRIKKRFSNISLIVTSEEMKGKLTTLLTKHIPMNAKFEETK